jgi:hypothetical protein
VIIAADADALCRLKGAERLIEDAAGGCMGLVSARPHHRRRASIASL